MAADGHKGNGSDSVRRLRELRFVRPADSSEHAPERRDFPVFPSAPADEPQADVATAPAVAGFVETFAKRYGAWNDRLSQRIAGMSFDWLRHSETELIARVALILLLVPLAFAFSPSRLPRMAKIEAPNLISEDRLSFAEGLRQQLISRTVSFHPERDGVPARKAEAAEAEVPPAATYEGSAELPPAEDPKTAAESTIEAASPELPTTIVDERRWSLPFNSQDYAIADLPASPQGSFKTEVELSSFPEGFGSIASQNVKPAVGPIVQTKRPAERRKSRVLAYSRRAPRIDRRSPIVVETVIVEQEKPAFPPLLFFLGNPPSPEEPVIPQNDPPKSEPWFPQSLQDIFKNQY